MHAYDFILILFSFVYAAAVTHLLSTVGEIIIASKRLRLSWLNAGWMLAALLFTCAWWIGLWDLHVANTWGVGSVALYFCIAAGIYLQARLVSPRIPERGEFDLQAFHSEEGRKYLIAYALPSWVTVAVNAVIGQSNGLLQWSAQNMVIVRPVPTFSEQDQLVAVLSRFWGRRNTRKRYIQRRFLEQVEAQNL